MKVVSEIKKKMFRRKLTAAESNRALGMLDWGQRQMSQKLLVYHKA